MDGKYDRRMRPQKEREIYKPGSGPLKRTDNDARSFGKNDSCERLNFSKNGKDESESNRNYSENSNYQKYDHYDRDKRKNRKPDAGIYVPKQNRQPAYSGGEGTSSTYPEKVDPKAVTRERCIVRENESNQRYDNPAKQSHKGSRNDLSQWKEPSKESTDFRKFDSRTHDARGGERNVYTNSTNNDDRGAGGGNSFQGEPNNGNFYNSRYDRNDHRGGGSDKNRMGRNTARRNSSNLPMLPDTFNNLPPRLKRRQLQTMGMTPEEIEKHLSNLNSYPNNSRDNRFSQTLPPKNNRNSHFKMNKNKEPQQQQQQPRNSRMFHQSKFNQSVETNPALSEKPNIEKWDSNSSVDVVEKPPVNDSVAPDDDRPSDDSSSDEEALLDDSNEVLNWAEEVEREHQKNNCETDGYRTNDDSNPNDKKRERKKRRSFSYERKEPQRTRNPSEGEYVGRRKEDDHQRTSNDSSHKPNEASTIAEGYLSWRRSKAPSPPRNRPGIMARGPPGYRVDKFDNRGGPGAAADRLNNKSKINSRINDLPSITKEIVNCPDKEQVAGIIKIPQPSTNQADMKCPPPMFPVPHHFSSYPNKPMKQLYNPTNPKQPIIISSQSGRAAVIPAPAQIAPHYTPPATEQAYVPAYMDPSVSAIVGPAYMAEHKEHYVMSRPAWYDAYSESFRSGQNAHLLLDISRADSELQTLLMPGTVILSWERIKELRNFLQEALKTLLRTDLKFCIGENVEQHMWKILFYNVIELLRKCMMEDAANSHKYRALLYSVLEQSTNYFHSLLTLLEGAYKIKVDDYLQVECQSTKSLGYARLALVSIQRVLISLGDLARYKETIEDSSSYTMARHWYVKANQIQPRNGRPYNQLAILAIYGKKMFDAVYYYMRSLMSSNPFLTARDSLIALFDENRKRYELVEKQRKDTKETKKQDKAKEKESVINGSMLRKETWIRPDGRRIQRTTSTSHECNDDSDADELTGLPAAEVYKRFLLSFMHVHGKLYSKVGLETLIEAGMEMLKEFRMCLSHSPLPIITTRLIQLLALNMFIIDNAQLKDPQIESTGYHSALQESALVISLQMFNLIINRCIQLLREQLQEVKSGAQGRQYPLIVGGDVQILLPAIKLWCDWLFCHSAVWNPPPSCQDYRISGCGDCWSRLAVLINILEELDYQQILKKNGFEDPILIMSNETSDMVKITLEEDTMLRGFTPLMCNAQQPVYTHKDIEMELAQVCLRIHRILFFGTMFLCGVDPPVLKLHKTETGKSEYISVVEEVVTPKDQSDNDNIEEAWSDQEEVNVGRDDKEDTEHSVRDNASGREEKDLRYRKKELERIHQKREKYMRDKKETMNKEIAAFSVEMEIKPHYLVPDTNCFIDRIPELERIVKAVSMSNQRPLYSLMVPVIVLSELEGIARGVLKEEAVTEKAKFALNFLQKRCSYANIKCVTTRGSVLPSTRFTSEEDYSKVENNDDKILTTCLNLCKHSSSNDTSTEQPKKIYREVVLLTEDRNLRVKALSSNMPVQTVTDFITWAGMR